MEQLQKAIKEIETQIFQNPSSQLITEQSLEFPQLNGEYLGSLEFNLRTQELSEAINSLKGGKTPRPDGIPIKIYI